MGTNSVGVAVNVKDGFRDCFSDIHLCIRDANFGEIDLVKYLCWVITSRPVD